MNLDLTIEEFSQSCELKRSGVRNSIIKRILKRRRKQRKILKYEYLLKEKKNPGRKYKNYLTPDIIQDWKNWNGDLPIYGYRIRQNR